eukprot:521022-Amphidinium_carterae.1
MVTSISIKQECDPVADRPRRQASAPTPGRDIDNVSDGRDLVNENSSWGWFVGSSWIVVAVHSARVEFSCLLGHARNLHWCRFAHSPLTSILNDIGRGHFRNQPQRAVFVVALSPQPALSHTFFGPCMHKTCKHEAERAWCLATEHSSTKDKFQYCAFFGSFLKRASVSR